MAISITKVPPAIAFSKNPIPVELTTNNLYSAAATAFEFRMYLQGTTSTSFSKTGAIAIDDYLFFSWEDKSVVSVAKAVPTNNGYEFPSGTGNLAHANAIKSSLELNKAIALDFLIEVVNAGGNVYLKFTSKRSLLFPSILFLGSNIHSTLTNESQGIERPNFKIWSEYFTTSVDSEGFKRTGARFDDVDSSGKVTLDVSEFLHPLLEFDKPTLRETNITRCTKSILKYYFLHNEFYGTSPIFQQLGWSSNYIILRGGLSRLQHPDNAFFSNYLSNKFLTWNDNNKKVRKNQPFYLTYIFRTPSLSSVRIRIETTYQTNGVKTKFTAPVSVYQNDKLLVPCGYTQLDVGSEHPTDKVISYKVTIVRHDTNTAVSESRTFIVDTSVKPFVRYFLYESSLGTAEVISTYGKAEEETAFDFQTAEIKLPAIYSPADADEIEYNNSKRESFEVNTGFILNKKEFEAFKDFFLSTEKYVYDQLKRVIVPIKINNKSFKFKKDAEGLYALKFEFSNRFEDQSYSLESFNFNPAEGTLGEIPDLNDSNSSE